MVSSLRYVEASVTMPLYASYALFSALFLAIFGVEAITVGNLIGTLLIIAGVAVISRERSKSNYLASSGISARETIIGIILALAGAVFWGVSIGIMRVILNYPGINGFSLTALRTAVIALLGQSMGALLVPRYRKC